MALTNKDFISRLRKVNNDLKGIQIGKVSKTAVLGGETIVISVSGERTEVSFAWTDDFNREREGRSIIDIRTKSLDSFLSDFIRRNRQDVDYLLCEIEQATQEIVETTSRIYVAMLAEHLPRFVANKLAGEEIPRTASDQLLSVASSYQQEFCTLFDEQTESVNFEWDFEYKGLRMRSSFTLALDLNIQTAFELLSSKDKIRGKVLEIAGHLNAIQKILNEGGNNELDH